MSARAAGLLALAIATAALLTAGKANASTGLWTGAGTMNTPREYQTATLLPSGSVLVAGGDDGGPLATAELYEPASNTWALTGSMDQGRSHHTAALLGNGKVLVAGGSGDTSAELYSPDSEMWTSAGTMAAARADATATLLPNGDVLVAGGHNGATYYSDAELYNPGTNSWSPIAASMSIARGWYTATLLASGKVLVVGGQSASSTSSTTASAELFDPVLGTWSPAASLAQKRADHRATLLSDGRVLVTGGYDGGTNLASPELYDPGANSWSPAASGLQSRHSHTAALLTDGRVLVAGGFPTGADEQIYNPALNSWSLTANMGVSRWAASGTVLPSEDYVLVVGGIRPPSVLASAELYVCGCSSASVGGVAELPRPIDFVAPGSAQGSSGRGGNSFALVTILMLGVVLACGSGWYARK